VGMQHLGKEILRSHGDACPENRNGKNSLTTNFYKICICYFYKLLKFLNQMCYNVNKIIMEGIWYDKRFI